jgi:hypothetical protein
MSSPFSDKPAKAQGNEDEALGRMFCHQSARLLNTAVASSGRVLASGPEPLELPSEHLLQAA